MFPQWNLTAGLKPSESSERVAETEKFSEAQHKQTNDNGKTFPRTLQVFSRKTKYIKTEQQQIFLGKCMLLQKWGGKTRIEKLFQGSVIFFLRLNWQGRGFWKGVQHGKHFSRTKGLNIGKSANFKKGKGRLLSLERKNMNNSNQIVVWMFTPISP